MRPPQSAPFSSSIFVFSTKELIVFTCLGRHFHFYIFTVSIWHSDDCGFPSCGIPRLALSSFGDKVNRTTFEISYNHCYVLSPYHAAWSRFRKQNILHSMTCTTQHVELVGPGLTLLWPAFPGHFHQLPTLVLTDGKEWRAPFSTRLHLLHIMWLGLNFWTKIFAETWRTRWVI